MPPLIRPKTSFRNLRLPDELKDESHLLRRATNEIGALESELKSELDTALKEDTRPRAEKLRDDHNDLEARYNRQVSRGPTDPALKGDLVQHKKRSKHVHKQYSKSSEETRLLREKAAREFAAGQLTEADVEEERRKRLEEATEAEWDDRYDRYDRQTGSHRYPDGTSRPPVPQSYSSPHLPHRSRSVQVYGPNHVMAGQPIVTATGTHIIGRESIEEYDRAPVIPSLPHPRRRSPPKPPRNPNEPARIRQPRGPPRGEQLRAQNPPQFGGNQPDYMQTTRVYGSHHTPERRENQNFNTRQGSGHSPYASMSTPAVNHPVQYPSHSNYPYPGPPTSNYGPPQGGSTYGQPQASGSGSGLPAHAQNSQFQPGPPSSNFYQQQPPWAYGGHPNNPYGQGY
ncbi:hypothetical protein C8F04DRAFT_1144853 [Mycena alexandri]|uniref:Uncharacterized protein n=1 Tax=Mycena alexandri TaxID=1745969 RepID=A0AAD6S4B1_9AGAR|nr:hypothetical protein C8F04DRAFT_1144853 [Mycena alexandri]